MVHTERKFCKQRIDFGLKRKRRGMRKEKREKHENGKKGEEERKNDSNVSWLSLLPSKNSSWKKLEKQVK